MRLSENRKLISFDPINLSLITCIIFSMADILSKLAALGVTKGFSAKTVRRDAMPQAAIAALSEHFPTGVPVRNEYGTVFNNRRTFPLGYVHGSVSLASGFTASPRMGCLLNEGLSLSKTNFIAMDTETSGLSADASAFVFMIGLSYFTERELIVDQLILPELGSEMAFLQAIRDIAAPFEAFVTYNGRGFDIPMIVSREKIHFMAHGFEGKAHIDLLHTVRRFWKKRLGQCRLHNVEEELMTFYRSEDEIPGSMAPDLYRDFLRDGDLSLMNGVAYHNAMDVVSLSAFMLRLNELACDMSSDADLEARYGIDAFAYRNALALADLSEIEADFILEPGRYTEPELLRAAQRLSRIERVDDALRVLARVFEMGNLSAGEKAASLYLRKKKQPEDALAIYQKIEGAILEDASLGEWSKAQKLDKIRGKIRSTQEKIGGNHVKSK